MGTLRLDDSAGFAGSVMGLAGKDTLDLRDTLLRLVFGTQSIWATVPRPV